MAHESKLQAGRKWEVKAEGIKSLSREYLVVLDGGSPLTANGEIISFPGVPAIGSAHPSYSNLIVTDYDVVERTAGAKNTLIVTAKYEAQEVTSGEIPDPGGGEPTEYDSAVEEWGWSDGTAQRELTEDVDTNDAVVNSAGDPFDRAPMVDEPAPVFRKVLKTAIRMPGWADYQCKVNAASVTIGDRECAARTLLCMVAESRIFGDARWHYRYSVTLRYRSNKQKEGGAAAASEFGWDVGVVDTGTREWKNNKKVLIRLLDEETGKVAAVSSPVLLDGSGHAQTQASQSATPSPYILRFAAYEDDTFPEWFYSEPALDGTGGE